MKIELEVDPGQLGKTLTEILQSLTSEERKGLARSAMESWLRDPMDIERRAKEQDVIEAIKRSSFSRSETDDEIRRGWDFRNKMNDFRSTKERMIDAITAEVAAHYKAEVSRVVESDPRIQAMKDEVVKTVLEAFPRTVHDALVLWVAGNLQRAMDGLESIALKAGDIETQQKQMADRLLAIGSRVGL